MNPADEHLSILLSSYLDGSLTPEELHQVVLALDSDLDAIAEFRRIKEARRAVRLLPTLDVPAYLLPPVHFAEELSAFLDGELSTTEMQMVTSHLESCPECRSELVDLDRSRIAVRALPGIEPPAFLDTHQSERIRSKRKMSAIIAVGASAAAVVLAFTVGALGGSPEAPAISITDLDARHAAVASVPSGVQVSNVGATP